MRNRLNKLFWFTDPLKLTLVEDKHLIIHTVLAYGSIADITFLFQLYSYSTIRKIFLQPKAGLYDPRALAFVQELLHVRRLNFNHYIRHVGQASS